ncbi:MAG: hypothetical protein QME74_01525 [Candidatus Edwardsbacteria bacterium]|nr:hypothetical protein [Candidatus Edwardsbacteria bacterium]
MTTEETSRETVGREALTLYERVKDIRIKDGVTFTVAAEALVGIRTARKSIADVYDPIITRMNGALKDTRAEMRKHDDPLAAVETAIKSKMATFSRVLEAERKAKEAELQALARKQEEDALLREAQRLEDMGRRREAFDLLEKPVVVPPVVLTSSTPKAEGVSFRKLWKFRVADAAKVPDEYWALDEQKIGRVVRALGPAAAIGGIEVYEEAVVAVRGGRPA